MKRPSRYKVTCAADGHDSKSGRVQWVGEGLWLGAIECERSVVNNQIDGMAYE